MTNTLAYLAHLLVFKKMKCCEYVPWLNSHHLVYCTIKNIYEGQGTGLGELRGWETALLGLRDTLNVKRVLNKRPNIPEPQFC
jgi:hypothetical protein